MKKTIVSFAWGMLFIPALTGCSFSEPPPKQHLKRIDYDLPFWPMFHLTQVRITASDTPLPEALKAVESMNVPDSYKNYGRAIVSCRSGEYNRALELLNKRCENDKPNAATFILDTQLRIQILMAQRRYSEALDVVDQAISKTPGRESFYIYKARILMAQGQAEKAILLLEELAITPGVSFFSLWHWLGTTYGQIGNKGRMKICMAKHALARKNVAQARLELEEGLKMLSPHDTYYPQAEDLKCTLFSC